MQSKEEVERLGIDIGNIITFDEEFVVFNNCLLTGPALDNSIGGFVLAEVARLLHDNKKRLGYGLYLVNSVQEETGKNGAVLMANNIMPDVAIVTDATHDTNSPMYSKKSMGDIRLGQGPVLTYAPTVQNNLLNMILEVAKKKNIAIQKKTGGKSTGTDADAFAFSDSGVATALISFPLKYMHTSLEAASKTDVEQMIHLIYEFLLHLQPGHDFRYEF